MLKKAQSEKERFERPHELVRISVTIYWREYVDAMLQSVSLYAKYLVKQQRVSSTTNLPSVTVS